ncbi:MAG: precorrin-3B C(17)-methyltransferase [Lachnospiraceae bacterium]|nr:precorrin-3B C(17)-methyltransferase [Lachnospiraceae bacterium]
MGRIYVVGIGPGDASMMTGQAADALKNSDVIVGYKTYIELIKDAYPDKDIRVSGMRMEIQRCRECLDLASKEGKIVALVCSGDPGIYGMASPMLELAAKEGFDDIEIIPGVSAMLSGAAVLGAPVNHDLCVISLSDLLTPWDLIEKRLRLAAAGDFCIVLYNPASHTRTGYLKRACDIMLTEKGPETCCGYVRNIGREGQEKVLCTLKDLAEKELDMFVTVFIGNSATRIVNGRLITPRGYLKQ